MTLLPAIRDEEEFDAWIARGVPAPEAVAAICLRHGLDGAWERTTVGSSLVHLSNDRCIKLLPPLESGAESRRIEVEALRHLDRALPIATPRVLAEGELEGWPYFVATRVPGVPIDQVWENAGPGLRQRLAAQLGEAIRVMHSVPLPAATRNGVHSEGGPSADWVDFVELQRARALGRERAHGLDPARLAELERFLSATDHLEPRRRLAFLHTQIGPSHALVEGDRVTGLIDFGEAMVGDPEYDLAAVGLFVTRGDRSAFAAFDRAYGTGDAEALDPARPRRLLRHALLHRYGTLAWYHEYLRPPDLSLEQLARHWFSA